ncbi:hypothetical protein [Demequina rhizosphaerae]|uniref:hypothetical protein n=1 Tax=Demequina rhizosphaerae TaxID=1638985 RepID=UPI0007813C83|nr:hypothetical protein [Demequina rhizosphaerae]
MAAATGRPPGVTFVVILTWVAAIGDLVTGAALVWLSLNMGGVDIALTASELRAYAFVLLAVGLLTSAFALGIAAGSQVSRVIVMIIMAARLAGGIYAYSVLGELVKWQALGQVVGSLLIVLALSTPRAFAYFRAS